MSRGMFFPDARHNFIIQGILHRRRTKYLWKTVVERTHTAQAPMQEKLAAESQQDGNGNTSIG